MTLHDKITAERDRLLAELDDTYTGMAVREIGGSRTDEHIAQLVRRARIEGALSALARLELECED